MVLLAAIDQGTSSSRFLVFDSETGTLVADHQIEVQQIFPQAGWVEMNPIEIYDTVIKCIEEVCHKLINLNIDANQIKAIGLANQRETTVVWDKETGLPLANAIVWLDSRTSALAEEFIQKTPTKDKEYFKEKCGLPIHNYFSALKLRWLIDNVEAVREAKSKETLLAGTVDSWILWKLLGKHITDVTNASRTMLLDLGKRKWSNELTTFFDIDINILPEIRSSAEIYGVVNVGSLRNVPLSGCLGDQQAALVGHNCLQPGDTKSTFGTGTFLLSNIGKNPVVSKCGLLTTVAFQFGENEPMVYALEGSGSIGGNVIRFLRDNLGFIKSNADSELLANSVQSTEGVYFVPCFSGLYTPHWDSTARGTICGLTQVSNKAHITKAALQAVAFQTAEMIEAIENDPKTPKILKLRIDGGMTFNKSFVQMQANVIGRQVDCPDMGEISGWGAAVAGGIGAGLVKLETYKHFVHPKVRSYIPTNDEAQRSYQLKKWKDAVSRARGWV
uniref:Glycerol kinase n=1 Tax=Rhabditophanes sp. KR3021 TaxID=114890 RepID=A0AC35TU99_9BILA